MVRRRRRARIPVAFLPIPGQEIPPEPVFAGRKPGRPALCPEPVLQRFLTALRAGNLRRTAAQYAGLSPGSVDNWMYRGQGHDAKRPPTPETKRFVALVLEAEATAAVLVTSNLVNRSRVSEQAAIFWLQHRYPQDWPKDPEAPGPAAGPVVIDQRVAHQQVLVLSGDEYPDLVAKLLEQKRVERAAIAPPVEVITEEAPRGSRHARLSSLRVESEDSAV